MDLSNVRREYTRASLRRGDLDADPVRQFMKWMTEAGKTVSSDREDPSAATLATADKDGFPSARIVLVKGIDDRGFIFFTNYESRKGRELSENPRAALVFYWAEHERQVCIAGTV